MIQKLMKINVHTNSNQVCFKTKLYASVLSKILKHFFGITIFDAIEYGHELTQGCQKP